MSKTLRELLEYKVKEPKYVTLAFQYADEYADGIFMKGVGCGIALGIIITLILLILII